MIDIAIESGSILMFSCGNHYYDVFMFKKYCHLQAIFGIITAQKDPLRHFGQVIISENLSLHL